MATITQVIAAGRRAMAANEIAIVQSLMEQYGIAWRHIDARLTEVEGYIEAALARGEVVDDAWLRRQAWWDSTIRSIETEMSRYTRSMAQSIASGQQVGVITARQTSTTIAQIIQTAANQRGINIGGVFPGRINPNVFERWVSAMQPTSPVRAAIDRYGVRVSESVLTRMTEGLAAGEHPRAITRQIVADVGDRAIEGRMQTLVRSEVLRPYRGALRETMESWGTDVVSSWRWYCSLGDRACPACISRHGRIYPFNAYPDQFHPGCRCSVQPIVNSDIIPARPIQTGADWFRKQDAAKQRKILRSNERYQAFQEGFTLDDFTGIRRDRVWGDSLRVKSMREVRAAQ